MPHFIALIHKDADSCYGVSFPDVAGVFTAGDSIDEAMQKAREVLAFAAEALRSDPEFQELAVDAVIYRSR